MKTNWEHQKKANTTDQKDRLDDEHIHAQDKQRVKQSETQASAIPSQKKRTS